MAGLFKQKQIGDNARADLERYVAQLNQAQQAQIADARSRDRSYQIGEYLINDSWPAQMVRTAIDAAALPGDVYAGRADPMSPESIGRATEMAGLVTLGAGAVPAQKNTLRAGLTGTRRQNAIDMDYDPDTAFYRGEGGARSQGAAKGDVQEYPGGASFSRDPEYNAGALGDNRQFRLNLKNALFGEKNMTIKQVSDVVQSAIKNGDEAFAEGLAGHLSVTPEQLRRIALNDPDAEIPLRGAKVWHLVDRSSSPIPILKDAGFDAYSMGHEVKKFGPEGIRHVDAKFDPKNADSKNIMMGIAAPVGAAMAWEEYQKYLEEGGA